MLGLVLLRRLGEIVGLVPAPLPLQGASRLGRVVISAIGGVQPSKARGVLRPDEPRDPAVSAA
jgi:hypothetical protein